ncbi:V-type ATP synthase subunit I [Tetragenococcus halophilus subsp. flandriensis]|uniref:V-type ATP synthase subunit I n=1 Tax=Tetragenococcus halophilus TaxID=51669 RepID=UPI0023E9A9EA|nr:V-type ATP synthase subunit I [Tetragenococcus halophilus]GMA08841.1 V-type ATP synthase subunit I [Tetragenococcus halophilus subsp. flandriensis]
MVVNPISKLSILAKKAQQDTILQMLQGMQSVEMEDILHTQENKEWLEKYFPENPTFDDAALSEYSEQLTQVREAISFIRNHGAAKQKIRTLKREEMDILSLENSYDKTKLSHFLSDIKDLQQQWEKTDSSLSYWQEAENWAGQWQSFDVDPEDDSQFTSFFLARASNEQWEDIQSYLKKSKIYYEINDTQKNELFFSGLFLKTEEAAIRKQLNELGVLFEQNPYEKSPKKMLAEAKDEQSRLWKKQKEMTKQIGKLKQQVSYLQLNEEILLTKIQREKAKENLVRSNYVVVIRSWIAAEDLPQIKDELFQVFNENELYFSLEEPTRPQIDENRVPTKLKNKALIRPFESLTSMYAMPKYEEIDPTPWMAPFYFVFFGMMVADTGYGLIILLASTIGLHFIPLKRNIKEFLRLFQILSFSIIFWGLIYGSVFGADLPFQLLNPTEDFMTIFMISLVFGGIQLFTGLFLAAKENIKKKDYLSAVREGFSWHGILIGLFMIAFGTMLVDSEVIKNSGIVLAIVNAVLIVGIPIIQSKSKVGGFFSGLYDLYGITGYIGDFVSYSRLMALGISGGSIAMAFNLLVGTLPPVARFTIGIVLLVILQALNIFLSMLSAYVHAARLQYVEYFGKFYEGGGKVFQPFKTDEKYINIRKKSEE